MRIREDALAWCFPAYAGERDVLMFAVSLMAISRRYAGAKVS